MTSRPGLRLDEVRRRLEPLAGPAAVKARARFSLHPGKALGLSVPQLRKLAREFGRDHRLAAQLWSTGIHDARVLATLVEEPACVTEAQMERWVRDLDSWGLCDACCQEVFPRTPFAYRKAIEWCARPEELVRRAGFALMAKLAVHDKQAGDAKFLRLLPLIEDGAADERHFVKKGVNWALREIGKRSPALNRAAIRTAKEIARLDSKAARWIAADALRELKSPAVRKRLQKKAWADRLTSRGGGVRARRRLSGARW